jgi:RNA polymerase sigma-70 factor (ECF subfamily)
LKGEEGSHSVTEGEQRILALLDRLYAAALRLAHNACDAEDLVQETYARALASVGDLRDPSRLEAWVFRILHNVFVNWLRARPITIPFSTAESATRAGRRSVRVPEPPDPAEAAFASMVSDGLDRALARLPAESREAVWLADVEEFSYAEISRIMDCPVGTVRSRIARGRALLLEHLQAERQAADARGRVGGA